MSISLSKRNDHSAPSTPVPMMMPGMMKIMARGDSSPIMMSKFIRMSTAITTRKSAAAPGAITLVNTPYPWWFRRNQKSTATEVIAMRNTNPNAAAVENQVNKVVTGNSSPSVEFAPPIAKIITTTRPTTDWAIEPPIGAPFLPSLPNTLGITFERPSAKK